jgi:protein phosphatase
MYLWLVGPEAEQFTVGEWVGVSSQDPSQNRYRVVAPRILLDTKPALLPDSPLDISLVMEPYLKLSHHKLSVPQVYGVLNLLDAVLDDGTRREFVLLENAPIQDYTPNGAAVPAVGPLPRLTEAWSGSSALRQLNWLWQIADLWAVLKQERVVSTLLCAENLRVEGDRVRLLELKLDRQTAPKIADLGQQWQQWIGTAHPDIQEFLSCLCSRMGQEPLDTGASVVQVLESALADVVRSRHISLATQTDQGPTRQRNEDACYPTSGTFWSLADPGIADRALPLLIVCDGIGGHEGGNVASGLAIATVQTHLQKALPTTDPHPLAIIHQMEQAVLNANTAISQRNDQEKRQERQRMGTTLVMTLIHDQALYLTHVGDSRAYRITRSNCHQVTLDDDLASRESRLGYALYRHALQKPSAGALIQALGMSASSLLHPTTQRFVLDEECLFLLCSDGLSDNDLVEHIWQSHLLPVLEGSLDVALASQRLVAIANSRNGHDNVTVGLIHCKTSTAGGTPAAVSTAWVTQAIAPPPPKQLVPSDPPAPAIAVATKVLPPPPKARSPLLILLGIIGLWVLGGGLAYSAFPGVRRWVNPMLSIRAVPSSEPEDVPSLSPLPVIPPKLAVDTLIQVNREALDSAGKFTVSLVSQPESADASGTPGILPVGTVLQISSRQEIPNQGAWLKIKVCSVPDPSRAAPLVPPPGTVGWVSEGTIALLVNPSPTLQSAQLGSCAASPSPIPSPSPSSQMINPPANPTAKRPESPQPYPKQP